MNLYAMHNILWIEITGKVTGMLIVTFQVTEVYKDFSKAEAPMICSMGISCEILLVDLPWARFKPVVPCPTNNLQ